MASMVRRIGLGLGFAGILLGLGLLWWAWAQASVFPEGFIRAGIWFKDYRDERVTDVRQSRKSEEIIVLALPILVVGGMLVGVSLPRTTAAKPTA